VRYKPPVLTPDLDYWIPKPALRIIHARESDAEPDSLWAAARAVRLADTRLLGRLIRWRIPGIGVTITFDQLFSSPPFLVLERRQRVLVSGLVGRIWTLRRDYPALTDPREFRSWSARGTARVLIATFVDDAATIISEARVDAFGMQGRLGLAAVRPLVSTSHHLIAAEGLEAAVRQATSAPDLTRS